MKDTTRRAILAILARKRTDSGKRRGTTPDRKGSPLNNAKVETRKDAVTKLHYNWQEENRTRMILTEKGRTWKQIAKRIRENEGATRSRLRISREDGTTLDENQTLGSTEDLPTKNRPAEVRREGDREENQEPNRQEEEKPDKEEDQQKQEEQKGQNSDRQKKEHKTPHRNGNETKDRAEEGGGKREGRREHPGGKDGKDKESKKDGPAQGRTRMEKQEKQDQTSAKQTKEGRRTEQDQEQRRRER
jgi:hypothetical protein